MATLLLVSSFVVAPQVAAQAAPNVKVEFDEKSSKTDLAQLVEGRLTPESTTARIAVKTTVSVPRLQGCVIPINIDYKVVGPAYSTPIINPGTDSKVIDFKSDQSGVPGSPINPADSEDVVFDAILTVTVKRAAPALEDGTYTVKVNMKSSGTTAGCTLAGSTGEGPYTIKNDYLPILQYTPTAQIIKTGQNKGVNFGVKMTNLGNGPTKIVIKVENPGKNKLDSFLAPAVQKLESKQTQGAAAKFEQDIIIQARTPSNNGYTNSFYSLLATFDASFDGVIKNGASDSQQIPLSVQVQGVYVPGFDAVSMVAALGLVLGILGMGRRRP